jgi:3-oxoadipate enol-lactonase
MPVIKRPEASVAYDLVGSGPTVILGHSLFCTRSMWDGVVAELKGEYRFVNIELRGHGDSTADNAFSLDDLADDWLTILDAESVDHAILCGLSTGGMTAMRIALRAPERVLGLALLDTNAGRQPYGERLQYAVLAWAYRHLGVLPEKAVLQGMFSPDTIRNRPDITLPFLEQLRNFHRRQLGRAMRAVFGRSAVDLAPLQCPTLVIVGEHDASTPPSCAQAIAETVRGSRLEIIAGAGHLTAVEQPRVVADLLRSFFAGCTAEYPP